MRLIVLPLLVACTPTASEVLPVDPVDPTVPEGQPDAFTVGPEGGSYTFSDGVVIDVPAGAVDTELTITMSLVDPPADFGVDATAYDFQPAGTEFIQPITLSIPSPAGGDHRLFTANGHGGFFQPSEPSDTLLTAQLNVLAQNIVAVNDDVEEITIIAPPAELDVLFVIDNSCSMWDEQQALATAFPALQQWFDGTDIDVHLGAVSTDIEDTTTGEGRLRLVDGQRWVDPNTVDASAVFASMVSMGTNGFYEERGFDAATLALTNTVENVGFRRPDAPLHVVFVSDEEDQSVTTPDPIDFVDFAHTQVEQPEDFVAHAVVGTSANWCPDVDSPGDDYVAAVNATGGVVHDLCDTDFSPLMTGVGFEAAGWERTYLFLHPADATTIEVLGDLPSGTTVTYDSADYRYDETLPGVVFDGDVVPEPGTVVRLRYLPL